MQSCEISIIQSYSITTTSTHNHHEQLVATTSMSMLNLPTTMILPPVGK